MLLRIPKAFETTLISEMIKKTMVLPEGPSQLLRRLPDPTHLTQQIQSAGIGHNKNVCTVF